MTDKSQAYKRVGSVRPHPSGLQATGGKADQLAASTPLPTETPHDGLRVPAWFTYDSTSPIGGHIEIVPSVSAEQLAVQFHEAYERLAPSFGYETREASAKPWAEVPENNRRLMIAVCAEIMASR